MRLLAALPLLGLDVMDLRGRRGRCEGDRPIADAEPNDLYVEADGKLSVTDTRNSRLRRIITKPGL